MVSKHESNERLEIRHHLVRSGDTFVAILASAGISGELADHFGSVCKSVPFGEIKEGDEFIFFLSSSDNLPVKVIYSQGDGPSYTVRKGLSDWECNSQESTPKGVLRTLHGRYAENFYDSCIAGGLPAAVVPTLADIFAYDIDFTSDLKDGDTFSVYYQEQGIESSEEKQFLILAAEMTVSGKTFNAYGFQLPDGSWDYFDAKGQSLRRAFLRTPMNYRRLMSPSSYKNVKPVLKIYRPHLGIDYAAPRGTPVSAIGDGVISSIKKTGKSGYSIEIRHRGGFKSVYANLSGVSRGLRRGNLVSQGEVIGSVGSSGSGKAYLDFHLYRDGKAVNFQTAEHPRLKIVPKFLVAEFDKTRESYSAALQTKAPSQAKQEILSGRD